MAMLTKGMKDPDISVVIRSRNDERYLKQLLEDIESQVFNGKVEIILVDTESSDSTVSIAKSKGAKIISLAQKDFNYPLALNLGFQAASHPYVVTLVGHSLLANKMVFKSLTYWSQKDMFGGLYSIPIANTNATIWDSLSSTLLAFQTRPQTLQKQSRGMLTANASIVKQAVWETLGGYDEAYAGGGEDVALARSMQAAGFLIVREPLMSLFHSHGLSFKNSIEQRLHWLQVGRVKPQPFNTHTIHKRRPDLR
jgi:rhamnosyltransferase